MTVAELIEKLLLMDQTATIYVLTTDEDVKTYLRPLESVDNEIYGRTLLID